MIKILIIEDDQMIARMYQKAFTAQGIGTEFAMDGEEGLAKAKMYNPSLILLDVMMPKLNGMQVLEQLKNNPATQNIPVVIFTNLSSQRDSEVALSMGAVKYIDKSNTEPDAIIGVVKEVLSKQTPSQS